MSPQAKEIKNLKSTITDMDCLAQDGFSRIRAIARLALSAMKTEDVIRLSEDFAKAFETICIIAHSAEECVNGEAEDVGCNFTSSLENLRYAARAAATERRAARHV